MCDIGVLFFTVTLVITARAQDYEVADINCDFGRDSSWSDTGREHLSARLKKPPSFRGHPLFADDRNSDPSRDEICQIRREKDDPSGLLYRLFVTNLEKCGSIKKNGYVHLRVWFPQLEGVVLATDQEVIIMCKPASPTVIENRAAGFAGALPSSARVSGIVEESPGRLEYEVALYRAVDARSGNTHSPVDQAVPIGSRLQLRAKINTDATWKYAKMMEVTVSSDPTNPHTPGYVSLVKDGCRLADFESIVPQQPQRLEDHPGEVRLDFEAFMLNSKMAGSSQLWIHATVKACIESFDCRPELCLDLRHPSGHGRRRKRKTTIYAEGLIEMLDDGTSFSPSTPKFDQTSHTPFSTSNTSREQDEVQDTEISEANLAVNDFLKFHMNGSSAKIGDNIGVTVIMPDEFFTNAEVLYHSCGTFILVSCFLGIVLLLASGYLCFLTSRLHKTVAQVHTSTLDTVMKEHHSKYSVGDLLKSPYL